MSVHNSVFSESILFWYQSCLQEVMSSHLITARAPRPDRLTVVSSTEQILIGPEVDQVHQSLATLWTFEAGGMPQGAMVTCALSMDSWSVLGNLTLATSTPLEDRGWKWKKVMYQTTETIQRGLRNFQSCKKHFLTKRGRAGRDWYFIQGDIKESETLTYSDFVLSFVPLVEPAAAAVLRLVEPWFPWSRASFLLLLLRSLASFAVLWVAASLRAPPSLGKATSPTPNTSCLYCFTNSSMEEICKKTKEK